MCRYPNSLGNTHHICCYQRHFVILLPLWWRITLIGNHKYQRLDQNTASLLYIEKVGADDSRIPTILSPTPTLIQQMSSSMRTVDKITSLPRNSITSRSSSPRPPHYVQVASSTTFASFSDTILTGTNACMAASPMTHAHTSIVFGAGNRPCQIRLRYTPGCNDYAVRQK